MSELTGVVFPLDGDSRSSSALGRRVVAAALEPADPMGARAARAETGWRRAYPQHFKRLVDAAAHAPEDAVRSARDGLDALRSSMQWHDEAGDQPLATPLVDDGSTPGTEVITGAGRPETTLSIPLRGKRIQGDDLRGQLDRWVDAGVMEPGAREAVNRVIDNPDWLRLDGFTLAVLGAGSEMGPMQAALRWGARVALVDLPRPAIWERVLGVARDGAGEVMLPVASGHHGLHERAGGDLLHDPGSLLRWISTIDGRLVLGNYVYADGATNLRLSAGVDALTSALVERRPDTALAYLATPTDVFQVPDGAVAQSIAAYDNARGSRLLRTPLRAVSGGRLLRRQYAPGVSPALSDSIVPQQGPNYLLAKRVHRWRSTVAADEGRLVSMTVAPPTRTRSVTKNRALAAAYAGAHRFGVEVFDPSTANTLMAALLVHDLHTGGVAARPGSALEAEGATAVHGGTWRTAYDPRSALGIAAVLGLGAARP